jgi:hypothetical protein
MGGFILYNNELTQSEEGLDAKSTPSSVSLHAFVSLGYPDATVPPAWIFTAVMVGVLIYELVFNNHFQG